jgi:1,4-dihydroxy-2-naphthoyl-CoA synthase
VITTVADGVMQIVINAPEARNSLSAKGVVDGLLAALDRLERDPELRCAVLSGAGGAFSSGGNLHELSSLSEAQVRAQMNTNTWLYRRIALWMVRPTVQAWVWPLAATGSWLESRLHFVAPLSVLALCPMRVCFGLCHHALVRVVHAE